AERFQGLYRLARNKFYLDEIYDSFFVQPIRGLAEFCRVFDQYVVDGVVDLVGQVPRLIGLVFRPIQNGLAQFYALAMALGVTVACLVIAVLLAVELSEISSGRVRDIGAMAMPTFQPEIVPGAPSSGDPHTTTWDLLPLGPGKSAIQFYIGLDGLNVWLVVL